MTRHKSLATAMSALLAYKNRPEGEPAPVTTNWSLVAADDNEPEIVASLPLDRKRLVTPSIEEIAKQWNEGVIVRSDDGILASVGKLKFSDGNKMESGYRYGPGGEVVATKHRMPECSLMGCRDKMDILLGNEDNPQEVTASNHYFADMFRVEKTSRTLVKKRLKRNGKGLTHAEAKAALADALANTPVLPPVTKCPPGLPTAGDRIADSFIGMQKSRCGDSGSLGWQDICTALVDREIWAQAIDELSDRDRRTLDALAEGRVKNYADLGVRLGMQREYARRKGGKRALEAANDNLVAAIKKVAA